MFIEDMGDISYFAKLLNFVNAKLLQPLFKTAIYLICLQELLLQRIKDDNADDFLRIQREELLEGLRSLLLGIAFTSILAGILFKLVEYISKICEAQVKTLQQFIYTNQVTPAFTSAWGAKAVERISKDVERIKQKIATEINDISAFDQSFDYHKARKTLPRDIADRFSKEYAKNESPALVFWHQAFMERNAIEKRRISETSSVCRTSLIF